MLINDNHNWYLLIAKDEKSGIAETKRVRLTNTHALMHTSVITGLPCVCVSSLSLYVQAISDTGVKSF